jgi:cytochrome d ubiquinol oxidase subunit II
VSLFTAHGAIFLTLRTRDELIGRSRAVARRVAPVSVALIVVFLIWTAANRSGATVASAQVAAVLAVLCAVAAALSVMREQDGRAFAFSAGTIALLFASLFCELFPNALPSTTRHALDLTLVASSSSHYTLTVMTVVAVVFLPIVLAYTAWTYWVFRFRLGASDFAGTGMPTPIAVLADKLGGGSEPGPTHEGSAPSGAG